MKVLKISLDESSGFVVATSYEEMLDIIQDGLGRDDFLSDVEGEVKINMEVVEMTEEELEALPEFEGF